MNLHGEPLRVGRTVHLEEREVTAAAARFYADTFAAGAARVPSLLFHSEVYAHTPRWYLRNLVGNLHARQEWELYAPLRVGSRIRTRATIVERYRKRDRDYVVNEVDYADEDGSLLVRGRTHQSFLVGEGPRQGYVVDQATAASKQSAAKKRWPAPGEGTGPELEPLELLVDREICWRFSGPGRNYHTDPDEARKLGFPDIVVQGMLGTCLIEGVMARGFGEGWVSGGRMDVKLTNVLWAGERVRARAKLSEELPEGDAVRRVMQVWVEKDDPKRTIVSVGTASALV